MQNSSFSIQNCITGPEHDQEEHRDQAAAAVENHPREGAAEALVDILPARTPLRLGDAPAKFIILNTKFLVLNELFLVFDKNPSSLLTGRWHCRDLA